MMKKIRDNKVYAAIFTAICAILVNNMIRLFWNNDFYLISVYGRYILEHGIPYYNPFFIKDGYETVIQQWLYGVGLYLSWRIGNYAGVFTFTAIQYVAFILLTIQYLKLYKIDGKIGFVFAFATIYHQLAWGCRPEIITDILLLIQMIAMKKYDLTRKKAYLYVLPLAMLIEINVHATMWFMHYIIILPFVVPFFEKNAFFVSFTKVFHIKNDNMKVTPDLLIPLLLMILAMFVNPYGIDAIMLAFDSRKSVSYVNIIEMKELNISMFEQMSCQFILLLLLGICIYKKKLTSTTFFMGLGLTLMTFLIMRNFMFLPLAMILCFADIFKNYDMHDFWIFFEKSNNIEKNILLAASVMFFGIMTAYGFNNFNKEISLDTDTCPQKAIEYIQESDKSWQDAVIFPEYTNASYFEWMGFQKVFIETRAETSALSLNHKRDIFKDYARAVYGYMSNTEYDILFEEFGFDYVLCNVYRNGQRLPNYLEESGVYEKVFESEQKAEIYGEKMSLYTLWRKKI